MESFEGEKGAAKVIIFANIFLVGSKLAVALLTGSLGVIAVLLDSLFDFVGGIFAYLGIKKAHEPPDKYHHYGHLKFGPLSGLAQLSLIFITAVLIILEAARRIVDPIALFITDLDLALMGGTIVVDIFMARYLTQKAEHYSSTALEASAGNYTSDVLQNSAVLIGLFVASWGFKLADPLSALLVALFMMRVVFMVGRKSVLELTDVRPSEETIEKIERIIRAQKGIKSFHNLRARSVSGRVYVDFHIQLNPKFPLKRAHGISEQLKQNILKRMPEVKEVLIHEEPFEKSG
ncbi:hypothetical protein DRN67_00225 [Candidatus Micrarchaeota archaeon]|nr:MAG: hypothetical protein DRN67_00225 [Candidatus Micrarchaeota archaeon]